MLRFTRTCKELGIAIAQKVVPVWLFAGLCASGIYGNERKGFKAAF